MMRRFNEELERFFGDFFGSHKQRTTSLTAHEGAWWPDIEVFSHGDKLIVKADLPGVQREDVQVEVRGNELSIFGERKTEHEQDEGNFYARERSYGSFCRTIPLPTGANVGTASATFKDGLLTVEIQTPELAGKSRRRIEVRQGESH